MIKNNKKGLTFAALLWMIGFVALFIIALGVISNQMNTLYGGNNDLTYGIVTNDTIEQMQSYQGTVKTDLEGGQSSFSSLGILTLTTLPKMLLSVTSLVLNFVTGGWIERAVELLPLGELGSPILLLLRVIFTILVIFIIIKLITRSPT